MRGVEGEIDAAVLPPAISVSAGDDEAAEAAPKPRRRRRSAGDEGDSETLSAVG